MAEPIRADFVIIGGGTAGCVLAARLSENGRYNVLLIEAGGRDINPWIHVPIGYGKLFGHPHLDWRYQTVPQDQMAGRTIGVPRGKVLGGSSSTNGLLYVRGQREDFDDWAAAGNIGWGYDDLLPYFRKAEDQQRGADAFHGVGGPLQVSDPTARHPLCDAFIAAADSVGIPPNPDFNGAVQEGAGYYQMTARGRRRCSTARGYLAPARARANLRIITSAEVQHIDFDGTRASGATFVRNGEALSAVASREVLLTAGAIGSPQMLMLSGIGPAADLQHNGIVPLADRGEVGRNLQDHLNIRTAYACTQDFTLNSRLMSISGRIGAGLEYLLLGRGPLTVAAGYAGAFYRSALAARRPDMQAFLLIFRTDKLGTRLSASSGFMISACQLRPESRGSVRLAAADPSQAPLVDPAYLTSETDRAVAIAGLRRMQEIVRAHPLIDLVGDAGTPPLDADDAVLMQHIRDNGSPGHHFSGSCRMGADADAVVDPRLRVRGVHGLRVVDGSIMPAVTSGNTLAPIVAIAEKAADMILEDSIERS